MPIYIGDSAQSEFSGKVSATMGSFGVDFDGTTTPGVDIDGSFNRTLGSFTASLQDGVVYPLLATGRGGNPNFGQDDSFSAADRAAMGLMDAVHMQGLDSGGHMDTPLSGYLARTVVNQEILNAHPTGNIYLFAYHNMMESPDLTLVGSGANEYERAVWIGNVTGPNGSDGWLYDSSGAKKSFFTNQFGVNITDEVTPDAQGRRYPEYYADEEVQVKYIDVQTAAGIKTGVGGVNVMLDNFQLHPNKTNVDWNFNGTANDAQDYYDLDDVRHSAFEVSVSSLTQSGGTATCVTATDHGLNDDGRVIISGASPSGYNGTFSEPNDSDPDSYTILNDTTFTYPVSAGLSSPATGTIVATPADRYSQPVRDAATFYASWRKNYQLGRKRIISNNPGIAILTNTNQWADDRDPAQATQTHSGSVATLPDIIEEYQLSGDPTQADVNGGWAEGNIHDGFPRSGVNQQGLNNSSGGSWQQFYNALYIVTSRAQFPKIIFGSGWIEGLKSPNTGAGGRNVYPNDPDPATTPWNLVRWFFATTQIAGAHFAPSGLRPGTTSGRAASTPIYDETGLINGSVDYGLGSGSTKLFHKWMGKRLSDPPTTAWKTHATGELWMAEFTNALIIVNTDNDEANSAVSIAPGDLPGGEGAWKFFNGTQDTSHNDGSTLETIPSQLEPIDGWILVRKSWYDAL